MASSAAEQALIAVQRFGLGARPGELAVARADPRGWLRAQLAVPPPIPPALRHYPPATERVAEAIEARMDSQSKDARKEVRADHREAWMEEAVDRVLVAVESPAPFYERLLRFFGDVLTVSISRTQCLGLVGPFEREVLRPGILGSYGDLLVASTQHPAMLVYLDNMRSTGPDSPRGRRQDEAGRNENLAREVLELHTLGAKGGYTQADVIALADILTGWGVATGRDGVEAGPHGFGFSALRHQPGGKTLLGRSWPEGLEGGEAALRHLATHPETGRHIGYRMARHFLADEPPPAVVEAIAQTWKKSGGDLRAAATTLIESDAAWTLPLQKLRRPEELIIATLRALDLDDFGTTDEGRKRVLRALRGMGQVPWSAPSPEGWPDTTAPWLGGDAMLRRVTWAETVADRAVWLEPAPLADALLGEAQAAGLTEAIARAPDRRTGVALVLACPQFQRR